MVPVEAQSILEYMRLEVQISFLLKTYISSIYIIAGDITMLGIFLSTHSILTCTSTGGPATNVTWTRGSDEDNLVPVSDNTSVSMLVNATTAQYIHTLNVSGTQLPAVYGCSVSNNKPSSANAIAILGITYFCLSIIIVFITCNVFIGVTSSKQVLAGEFVNLTCSTIFGSEDSNTSSVQFLWSGPAINDYGNNRILSLHGIHLSDAGEYKCTATTPNSFVTSVIVSMLKVSHAVI